VVLAVVAAAGQTVALLQAGRPGAADLMLASSRGRGWSVSSPAPLGGRFVSSVSFGANGAVGVVLSASLGLVLTGTSGAWQSLPRLPGRTQALSLGPGALVQALAPARTSVSVWDYRASPASWVMGQKLRVPVQFGSSS
jgi:hypothetical protein